MEHNLKYESYNVGNSPLGFHSTMVHRKFRWYAEFKKGEEVLWKAFVKLSNRPDYVVEGEIDKNNVNYLRNYESQELTITLFGLDDESYKNCWQHNLNKITEIELGLYDGCGNLIETWTIPGPKVKAIKASSSIQETKFIQDPQKNTRTAEHDVEILVEYAAINYECKLCPVKKLDPTEGIPKA